MSTPHDPNDPFNQQPSGQPGEQDSVSPTESQSWDQQSSGQPSWGDQDQQPADQWSGQAQQPGNQWSGQAQQPANQWSGQAQQPTNQWSGQAQQQADPYARQYGQQQAWSGAQPQQPGFMPTDGKSFFAALFDFNFTSFVTPKIIKVVYIVLTAAIGLGVLFFFISALVSRQPLIIIGALILGPLIGLIYMALARMSLELYYAVIRLSEDVHARLPRL